MANCHKDKHPDADSNSSDQGVDVPDRGEATVEITEKPPASGHKRPHRRRPAPPVPDAESPEGE